MRFNKPIIIRIICTMKKTAITIFLCSLLRSPEPSWFAFRSTPGWNKGLGAIFERSYSQKFNNFDQLNMWSHENINHNFNNSWDLNIAKYSLLSSCIDGYLSSYWTWSWFGMEYCKTRLFINFYFCSNSPGNNSEKESNLWIKVIGEAYIRHQDRFGDRELADFIRYATLRPFDCFNNTSLFYPSLKLLLWQM